MLWFTVSVQATIQYNEFEQHISKMIATYPVPNSGNATIITQERGPNDMCT